LPSNKYVGILFSAHAAFLEQPLLGTLKVKKKSKSINLKVFGSN